MKEFLGEYYAAVITMAAGVLAVSLVYAIFIGTNSPMASIIDSYLFSLIG